jgi:hypothetical protein
VTVCSNGAKTNIKFSFKTGKMSTETFQMIKRARFVQHCLIDEQNALRLHACQEAIQSVDDYGSLLDSTVMGDETWCFQYDPQIKRQSMEWRSPSSPRYKKFRFQNKK